MKRNFLVIAVCMLTQFAFAQTDSKWQQKVDYQIDADVDVANYQYDGKMKLTYFNNSPDVLNKVYFHLYFNAFQPGSAMDYRLSNIADPDNRMVSNEGTKENPKMVSRIAKLKPNEIGYQKINSIKQDGVELKTKVYGTILEVTLAKPIQAGSSSLFNLEWKSQIPVQIRRSGRNNSEGVELSMTQWYPKMAMYDQSGWNLEEYIGREFFAPFGDFDVTLHLPQDYVVGASGTIQNPEEVKGYSTTAKVKATKGKVNWHFKAENIHDFAWAADKDFVVEKQQVPQGPLVYFVYQPGEKTNTSWKEVQPLVVSYYQFMKTHFGAYPWKNYSIIQGGDGGMEYGMCTLITGNRNTESLAGVIFHEASHSWFQQLFGTDETVDEWMDEGFTSYAEQLAMNEIINKTNPDNPNADAYGGYYYLAKSGHEEPMSLLADFYDYNQAYSIEAYYKGQVLAIQLGYIIGDDNLKKVWLAYYDKWKFRHPSPEDFMKVAEDVSGINLKWYFNQFVNTTRKIDLSIDSVTDQEIKLKNKSNFAMPVDLYVEYEDGSKELFYIPQLDMRGAKPAENFLLYQGIKRTQLEDWAWTNPNYSVKITKKVKKAILDPTQRIADVDFSNNLFPKQ